nr:alpha/beta hydrolase [uncultured Rhodopila sp.]
MQFSLVVLFVLLSSLARAEERFDLPSRPGVIQPIYATFSAGARASVILFPGGNGLYASGRKNFLRRIVPDLLNSGFSVITVDAPSDQSAGMSWTFRAGPEQARDIEAVASFVKARSPAPIWLIGTSRGSVSAADGASVLGRRIGGVILTSSVWARGMAAVRLETITVPVLVIHNRDDGCPESPFAGAEAGIRRLTGAPVSQLVVVSGGLSRGDACQATSPHGFLGIEKPVVDAMVLWIRSH